MPIRSKNSRVRLALAASLAVGMLAPVAIAQQTRPAITPGLSIAAGLAGREIESVQVRGNAQVSSAVILNVVRSRVGEPLDAATVQEDYQRIFALRRFANVEARAEPTDNGRVIVIFQVTEQRQIREIEFAGNRRFDDAALLSAIDIERGQSIDNFRINNARRSIEHLYRDKNYPYTTVTVNQQVLAQSGELRFDIVEGNLVRVANVDFIGNNSFSEFRLKRRIGTKARLFPLVSGQFDPERLEDDIASIRDFYRGRGFFDARVGRKLVWSPDSRSVQVEFVIDEGPRYTIDSVTFRGNTSLTEAQLRELLKLVEGQPYEQSIVDRDIRRLVEAYSPFGMIYQPGASDPAYLTITPQPRFKLAAGRVDLVYDIKEGKEFKIGNIEIRGNSRTQQKVLLRQLHVAPGETYNSAEVARGLARIKSLPNFSNVKITPIGTDPESRDLLVEVEEAKTAILTFGAGINSNGGVSGNITYLQRNFDIRNVPRSPKDVFKDTSFTGAGQTLRISLEPGTEATNASISFTEPFLLDQPYSLTTEAYYRTRKREAYDDNRIGARVRLGKQFSDIWSGSLGVRLEDVSIDNIRDEPVRAEEILDEQGHHFLSGVQVSAKRDTTNPGPLAYEGTTTQFNWESMGLLGGEYTFQRFSASFDYYKSLGSDLLDRRTIYAFRSDAGYIAGNAPFFERFYGGGINNIRGFRFRGVSPRSGPDDDPIGGDFFAVASNEISFPLYQDNLRGVAFIDVGTVESDLSLGTIRSAAGVGIRLTLPVLGQVPIAIDLGIPLTKDSDDDTQLISFSLGITP